MAIYFHITRLTGGAKEKGGKKRKSSIKNVHTELGKINEFGLALVSAGLLPEASHKVKSISREGVVKKKENPIWIDPRVV